MSPPKRSPESIDELRASLVGHALALIEREGVEALTMRALAAEADCSIGLPYKVFADRRELVQAILARELDELHSLVTALLDRTGQHSIGANLAWFAGRFLASPAAPLVREEISAEPDAAHLHGSTSGMNDLEGALGEYLAAEQETGRVRTDVDTGAIGALIAGALHNLVVAGPAWPRPTATVLRRRLDALAAAITP